MQAVFIVNISPIHFLDINLVAMIRCVLDEKGMIPAELELEVTESVVQTNQENLSTFKIDESKGNIFSFSVFCFFIDFNK